MLHLEGDIFGKVFRGISGGTCEGNFRGKLHGTTHICPFRSRERLGVAKERVRIRRMEGRLLLLLGLLLLLLLGLLDLGLFFKAFHIISHHFTAGDYWYILFFFNSDFRFQISQLCSTLVSFSSKMIDYIQSSCRSSQSQS